MDAPHLALETRVTEGSVLITVAGELDVAVEDEFIDYFAAQATASGPVTIDLTDVAFIDSRGLSTLLRAVESIRSTGSVATVVHVAPQGLKLFEMSGLKDHLMGAEA